MRGNSPLSLIARVASSSSAAHSLRVRAGAGASAAPSRRADARRAGESSDARATRGCVGASTWRQRGRGVRAGRAWQACPARPRTPPAAPAAARSSRPAVSRRRAARPAAARGARVAAAVRGGARLKMAALGSFPLASFSRRRGAQSRALRRRPRLRREVRVLELQQVLVRRSSAARALHRRTLQRPGGQAGKWASRGHATSTRQPWRRRAVRLAGCSKSWRQRAGVLSEVHTPPARRRAPVCRRSGRKRAATARAPSCEPQRGHDSTGVTTRVVNRAGASKVGPGGGANTRAANAPPPVQQAYCRSRRGCCAVPRRRG